MIYTVLGAIEAEQLGVTLPHEHIVWSDQDLNEELEQGQLYDMSDVLRVMTPYLRAVKEAGCTTFVDATPPGCGRSVAVLQECAQATGLQIITNTGAFLDFGGVYISQKVQEQSSEELAADWITEFEQGIEGTGVKPGFIKIALSSDQVLTTLEAKVVRAAALASLATGLPVQCHVAYAVKAKAAVKIVTEEGLPLDRFVWVHADAERDLATMLELAAAGIWLELDCWAREKLFSETVQTLKELIAQGLEAQLLLSQDSGTYGFADSPILACEPLLTELVPYCLEEGISQEIIDQILITNPARLFDIS